MFYYYYYFVILTLLQPFLQARTIWLVALTFPVFLLTLPDTGFDFSFYQTAYENTYFDLTAPLFFRSTAVLTAEPGWFAFTGLVGFIISDFRQFLVFNFLLCLLLLWHASRLLKIDPKDFALMVVLYLPVCFITIMFWSPRSALPYALVILGIAYLQVDRKILGFVLMVIAVMIHTQYAVIATTAVIYFSLRHTTMFANHRISIMIVVVAIFLAILVFRENVVGFFSFLPSAEIAQSKLRYLGETQSAFRLSSLLSIIVFPAFVALRFKHLSKLIHFDTLIFLVSMSLMLTVAFFDNSHVAGRLARASDYFLFPYVFSQSALVFFKRFGALVLLPIMLILPFAYGDLYDVNEIFPFFYSWYK